MIDLIPIVIVPVVIVIALLLSRSSIETRTETAARRAATTSIRQVHEGQPIVIVGMVRFVDETLDAPLSGRRGSYFRSTCTGPATFLFPCEQQFCVAEVQSAEAARDFLIEDKTGTALVEVGAGLLVDPLPPECSRMFEQPDSERVAHFLEQRGVARKQHGDWEAKEWVLEDGDTVAVFGIGRWEVDPSHGSVSGNPYRDAPRRLVVRAPAGLRVLVTEQLEVSA